MNQDTGYFRTPELADGQTYEIRARRIRSGLASLTLTLNDNVSDITKVGPWTAVTGIVVVANDTAPAQPELITAGRSGDTISITFRPDLGANYAQTGVWRGPTFATATFHRWVRDQASTITTTITVSGSAQPVWLRSANGSAVTSAPLNIGSF